MGELKNDIWYISNYVEAYLIVIFLLYHYNHIYTDI